VSPYALIDRRNPAPHIATAWWAEPEPEVVFDDPVYWHLPGIETHLASRLVLDMPSPVVSGYDYRMCDQPYLLELWIEKTTMNDELLPVCRRLGINLVTSAGFQSITSAVNLLKRVHECDKPARVLYISDFDPAGDGMPPAVARQIEFWLPTYAPGADVCLIATHADPRAGDRLRAAADSH